MTHGPHKKPSNSDGNPDHVTLVLGATVHRHGRIFLTWRLFSSNSCVMSAALAEICALLSVILVKKNVFGFVIVVVN